VAWTCWPTPPRFRVPGTLRWCDACAPFEDNDEFIAALSVQIGAMGVTAERPKKSEGCWKCGGNGVLKVEADDYDARGEYEGPPLVVVHQPDKPEPPC
jgi:hypothetical protein